MKNDVLEQRRALGRLARLRETRPVAEARACEMVEALNFPPEIAAIVASSVLNKHEGPIQRKLAAAAGLDEDEFAIGNKPTETEEDEMDFGKAPLGGKSPFGGHAPIDNVRLKSEEVDEEDGSPFDGPLDEEEPDAQLTPGSTFSVKLPNGEILELSLEAPEGEESEEGGFSFGGEDEEVEEGGESEVPEVEPADEGEDMEKESRRANYRRQLVAKALENIKPKNIGLGSDERPGKNFTFKDGYWTKEGIKNIVIKDKVI